jgi:hypothetical protein
VAGKNMQDIAVTSDGSSDYTGISNYQGYNDNRSAPAANLFSFSESSFPYEDYDNSCMNFAYYHNFENTSSFHVIPRDGHYTNNTVLLLKTIFPYSKEYSCIDNYSDKSLGELYTEMNVSTTELNSTTVELRQLVDGGNTEALKSQVELSTPPQALQLHNTLLVKSPYLSDSVMFTAITNEDALPPIMLKDVLVANPQSSKSETLMDNLLERNNPLPDYMIAEIEAGKNIISAKENLEAKIAYYYQEKELAFNEIIRCYKNDSTHTWANDSIVALLDRKHTTYAKYYLAFDKLNKDKLLEAEQLLNNIPLNFNLNNYELSNFNDYNNYMQLLIRLQQDCISIYDMNEGQKQVLQSLALKNNNYANAYASNILIIADSMQYDEPIILPSEQGKILHKKKSKGKETENESMLNVFPNPAKDYFTIEYNLKSNFSNATVKVCNITGKELKTIEIKDKQNQLIIETSLFANGIYYVYLIKDGAIMQTKKINIIK